MNDATNADHAAGGERRDDAGSLALQGYDPVACVMEGRAREHREEICHVHAGRLYRFASADHRARFVEDPQRYLPQYDGFCALGIADEAVIEWRRDPAGNITKANAAWRVIGASEAGER